MRRLAKARAARMQMSRTLAADAVAAGLAPEAARAAAPRAVRGALAAAWAWPAAALAIVAVSLAPFLVVDVPAVLDYPNHLARFYILAHPHDPILSKMYAPHWAILPNIGMDVLGAALLSVLPTDVGGRILLAISLLAPPAGAVLYARAAFGRWTWWSLGAGVVAYNALFFLGFMNFLLGLGVGFAGAAAWVVLRRQGRNVTAALVGAVIGLCAFFCHLIGFGCFALLIGAREAEPLLVDLWRRRLSWRAAASAAALLIAALAPSIVLYGLTHRPVGHGDIVLWTLAGKTLEVFTPFMTYSLVAMAATTAVVIGAATVMNAGARRASGFTLAMIALAVLYVASPFAAGGGSYVETRFPIMAALLLFAGMAPRQPPRVAIAVGVAFALLIAGRAALTAVNWQGRAQDLVELRSELALVPAGAKLLPARTEVPTVEPRLDGRQLPLLERLDNHLPALALLERRAFWPLLFADPNQQPVVAVAPYDRLAEPLAFPAPWENLFPQTPAPAVLAKFGYLRDWRERYDFVLSVGPQPRVLPAGLTLVRTGYATTLFRVDRLATAAQTP
jgi:hypothetical protein